MVLKLKDFITEHRFVILLDLIKYSELSDEHQLEAINTLTDNSQKIIDESGFVKEDIFSSFIPTGDGFYIIGDERQSIFWSSACVIFVLKLRNELIKVIKSFSFKCEGIKIAIHFGTTLEFTDILGNKNYVGRAMNESARLLSPINKKQVSMISSEFYGHENSVIISQPALDRIDDLKKLGVKKVIHLVF
jgi:hypothetical protein